MSDPGALVCVRKDEAAAARRWRRRGSSAHTAATRPSARPPLSLRALRRPGLLSAAVGGAVLAAAWLGVTAALAHSNDSALSRRIGAGCEELAPCQSLEAEAERRLERCSLLCGGAAAEYEAARLLRFRAEERRAVREHYRVRDDAELQQRELERARRLDDWQRQEAARVEEASRERQHRLELERLRQAHIERRLAEERQRRASYYSALGSKGRAKRLERCLASSERCDALTLDLLDATANEAERRSLAQLNEGVTPPAGKASARPEHAPFMQPDALEPASRARAAGPATVALEPTQVEEAPSANEPGTDSGREVLAPSS